MKLHESESIGRDKIRTAVPGGWIYSTDHGPRVFVPDPTCEHWQTQNRIPLKGGWAWWPEVEHHHWGLIKEGERVGTAYPSGSWVLWKNAGLIADHRFTAGFSLMPAMWALARHLDAVAE